MQAIHQSIKSAAKNVDDQGVHHINNFFDKIGPADKDNPTAKTIYRPKTYSMEFPSRTPEGIKTVTVEVPLITLAPISNPKISEVKFTTELEVSSDENGEILVSFPTPKKHSFFPKEDGNGLTNTKIEITLKGTEPPEGLKRLIEGYERALRAQIPG